jgi:hypothetical protein
MWGIKNDNSFIFKGLNNSMTFSQMFGAALGSNFMRSCWAADLMAGAKLVRLRKSGSLGANKSTE